MSDFDQAIREACARLRQLADITFSLERSLEGEGAKEQIRYLRDGLGEIAGALENAWQDVLVETWERGRK